MTAIEYSLVRSKRKSVSIQIHPNKGVIVRAPYKSKISDIEKFIDKKESWIKRKIEELGGIKTVDRDYIAEPWINILGIKTPIEYISQISTRTRFQYDSHITVYTNKLENEVIKTIITRNFRSMALDYLQKKTQYWFGIISQIYDIKSPSVKVRQYKSRWGSTNSNNSITYNWRLIMADETIIDYVVVHELIHLVEFNHSKRYWRIVGKFCPEYKSTRKILKLEGHTFII